MPLSTGFCLEATVDQCFVQYEKHYRSFQIILSNECQYFNAIPCSAFVFCICLHIFSFIWVFHLFHITLLYLSSQLCHMFLHIILKLYLFNLVLAICLLIPGITRLFYSAVCQLVTCNLLHKIFTILDVISSEFSSNLLVCSWLAVQCLLVFNFHK